MMGTRAYEASQGHVSRPAIEGIRVGDQNVKHVRGSLVYLTANFVNVTRAVPVNPDDLDKNWLYEARIGYSGDGTKVTGISKMNYGAQSIETLVAQAVPELKRGEVLCVRAEKKKPKVLAKESREKPRTKRRVVRVGED